MTVTRLVPPALALAIACAACKDRDAKSQASTTQLPESTTQSPVPADANPPKPTLAADAGLKDHMKEHFAAITEIQRSVVRSNLPAAQAAARYLAEHVEHQAVAQWQPHVAALRAAANRVVAAADLPTAAVEAAVLGRACASCHQAHSAIVTFAWEPEPEGDATLAAQMKKHQWAAARLWEGLIGPSDEMWNQGAAALAATRLDQIAAQTKAGATDVAPFAATVRTLARRAGVTADEDARAILYGDLLKACASCHRVARDPQPNAGAGH